MADDRDEIRARVDLVDLVSQRVALKRAGKHFKGLCPFHEDKNPSFFVDPQTGRYKCWSCGESGDIFTWVMKTEHLEFGEALKELALRAGVTLSHRGSSVSASEREIHRTAMTEALAFFREQLSLSQVAKSYCESRALDAETLATWQVGYAPDVGEALATLLKKKGISLNEGKNLFLVDQDASGGYFDRFRGRLMFPIFDEKGSLVAFGGRLLGDGHPKYINSSDTPLYRKSRVLYGMHRARDFFAKEKKAILVEGYLDVIACHRAGLEGAVASLGTSLSEDHAKLLKRWVDEVTILYDADDAGQKAAERAVGIFEEQDVRVKVALMPPGNDPDTLLRSEGPAAVKKAAAAGRSALDFRLYSLRRRLDTKSEEFWQEALEILVKARSHVEVDEQLLSLSMIYPGLRDAHAAQERLKDMLAQTRRRLNPPRAAARARPVAKPEHVPLQEQLTTAEFVIFLSLHERSLQTIAWTELKNSIEILETGGAATLAQAILEAFSTSPPEGPFSDWLHRIEPEAARQTLSDLLDDFRSKNLTLDRLNESIAHLHKRLEKRDLRNRTRTEMTPEDRQDLLRRARTLNPDPKMSKPAANKDPFA